MTMRMPSQKVLAAAASGLWIAGWLALSTIRVLQGEWPDAEEHAIAGGIAVAIYKGLSGDPDSDKGA